jgi:16S rRNA (cytosine967-C5)-methyltransferase
MVLDKAGTEGFIPPATLRLSNGVKVEELFTPDVEVVVQDYSSQRIGALLVDEVPRRYWDACAASGGKTLLVFDRYPSVEITVSDLRESILRNLEQRFQRAGIKQYTAMTADLQKSGTGPTRKPFDLVLADVPCTGSGTWSRTPEELYFFDPAKIDVYSERQRKIMDNILPKIQEGGRLVYITCSVFRKENEEMLQYLQSRRGMTVEEGGSIIGYADRADTMFAARLRP